MLAIADILDELSPIFVFGHGLERTWGRLLVPGEGLSSLLGSCLPLSALAKGLLQGAFSMYVGASMIAKNTST